MVGRRIVTEIGLWIYSKVIKTFNKLKFSKRNIHCPYPDLQKFRGGCIICMDYGHFSLANYPTLRTHFNGIVSELTNKLSILHMDFSFHPNNIYMFGFSFGAHIVLESAKRFTANHKKKIRQIDGIFVCPLIYYSRIAGDI